MSYEDDKAQMEFLADPRRVNEQKQLEAAWVFPLLLIVSCIVGALAYVIVQLLLMSRIAG